MYALAPAGSLQDLGHHLRSGPSSRLILAGAIAGNLRSVALSTTVTLLVPEDERDKANGLVGTVNGVAFAITSVFSGLAIGLLGMGACLVIAIVLTAGAAVHLMSISHHGGRTRARQGRPDASSTSRGRCAPFGSSPG